MGFFRIARDRPEPLSKVRIPLGLPIKARGYGLFLIDGLLFDALLMPSESRIGHFKLGTGSMSLRFQERCPIGQPLLFVGFQERACRGWRLLLWWCDRALQT